MRLIVTTLASVLAIGIAFAAPEARAQSQASPTAKGITGGALLGAEAVMLTEAAFDVRPAWAYAVGGGIGAIGGGVAGYFVEESSARASILLLAGGMVLAIPTAVAVLSVTAYQPPADYTQDRPPSDEPVADPPQPTSQTAVPKAERTASHSPRHRSPSTAKSRPVAATPPTLLDVGTLASVSLPSLEVRDLYTRQELLQYGVKQGTEVRLSFLNVLF